MILGAEPDAVPNFFGFHRGPSATRNDLDSATGQSRNRKSGQHRQKDARPFFVAAPPGTPGQYESESEVFRPITKSTYIAHEMVQLPILMMRDEMPDRFIKVKCRPYHKCGN